MSLPQLPETNAPRRRAWLLLLATLLALAAGAAYFWKFGGGARGEELLHFTALFVSSPLALSVILLFAYYRYPPR